MIKKDADVSAIMDLSVAFQKSAILQSAVKLEIFSRLEKRGKTSSLLASEMGSDERGLSILLDALAGMNFLIKRGKKYFNSPDAEKFLVKGSEHYYGNMIEFDALQWSFWDKLSDSVKSGKPARTPDMFQNNEEETEKFIMGMHSIAMARGNAQYLAQKIDLKNCGWLIDIGGGPGTFSVAFCRENPKLRATVFDFSGTLKITKKVIEQFVMEDRIDLMPGDFNKDNLPTGFDAAFLSNIIHSESAEKNVALMKKIYDSMNPGGMIIIKDHILDNSGTKPPDAAIFSTVMLLFTQGRSYRFIEVSDWLKQAGFKKISLFDPGPPVFSQIITARKSSK